MTGGKSVTGKGNAPIEVQTQNGRKVYRFNGAGPWSPVPTDASGKPDLAAISQIKRPMITERATQDRLGNATAQALTFAVPGGGSSGARKVVGEGVGLAEGLAKTPFRPIVRVANKATGGKLLDPVYQAKQTLAAAIKRDGGSPEQVAQIVNEWQATGASSPSLLDAVSKLPTGGQATLAEVRGAAMNSPVARGTAKAYRNNIEANLQDNAQNLTDRLHPDMRTTQQFVDDTKALRSRNAESLYRDDYATQLPVNKETLTGLSDAPGRSALARSRASAVANGRWDQVAEIDQLLQAQKGPVDWTSRGPQFNVLDALTGKAAERLPEVPTVSGGTLDRARIQTITPAPQN
ncbi:MAG: hypothetical protein NVV72_15795 [Asticcacaulis sp.]|nr:hypothetical protein [Asticcacaulis sp.]